MHFVVVYHGVFYYYKVFIILYIFTQLLNNFFIYLWYKWKAYNMYTSNISLLFLFKICWHIPENGILCCLLLSMSFDALYAFCRNYLTTFLPIHDINEKYPIYIIIISWCCCSKLIYTFYDMAHYGVFYYQQAFISSIIRSWL